jgi:molybdate transport system substrate-binding protein
MRATAAALVLALVSFGAGAAEITFICSNALKSVMEELAPQFEKASGHRLRVTYGTTGPLQAEIEKGAVFDVTILGPAAIDELIKRGRLAAASRTDVARSGLGVAVRKGAPKPDLSSADSFKRSMLGAKSIAFLETGLTGTHLWTVFQRLGMTDEMKARHRNGRGAEMVAEGKAEFGMTQISEILHVTGVELAGPLPAEIQNYTVFAGAVRAGSNESAAAQALLEYLRSPEAVKVMRAKGLESAG